MATVRKIRMPDIGEGIAEVEVVAWHVATGDQVHEDQVLAEVMTDKATVEIPSPVAGRVAVLHAQVGQKMAVGADLVEIEVGEPHPTGAERVEKSAGASDGRDLAVAASTVASDVRPPAAAQATANVARTSAEPEEAPVSGTPRLASPAVRKRARDLDIDLAEVVASGPEGRIVHADLDRHLRQRSASTDVVASRRSPAESSAPAQPGAAPATTMQDQSVAIVGLRRRIAQRMQEAKRRIPHFSYVEEVDVTELESLREQLNERWGSIRGRLTLLPLLVQALCRAMPQFPQINAHFDDEAGVVNRFAAIHVGVATQTASGLMVPVLRNAQAADLWANASRIASLAEAARNGRATREELSGSTITITSLGALGGIASTPIVNLPEVAIVGVNRIVERPVMRGGAVVARKMMNLSSSFDHRVVDGMDAARFIQAVRALLEQPALMFID